MGPEQRLRGMLGTYLQLCSEMLTVSSVQVFQTYYATERYPSKSPSDIAWVGSLQSFLLLFVGVLSGPLYDAGYFRALLVAGNFFVVFGLMMTSLCQEFWQVVLAQGITCGIGYGLLFIPGVSVIPQWWVKRRVLASGLAASGSGFGTRCATSKRVQHLADPYV